MSGYCEKCGCQGHHLDGCNNSIEDQQSQELYMCRTDYDHELGCALGGNVVYPSIEDLKRHRSCISECGIVAVCIEFVRVIEEGSLNGE